MKFPSHVDVVEVGPRDGLQIEPAFVPTETKIRLINDLIAAGLRRIEATAFVSHRAVPQMRDAARVVAGIDRSSGARVAVLVPNPRGAEDAAAARVDEMVVFVSASESHNRTNVNCSIAQSLAGIAGIAGIARAAGIEVHGAIATSLGCPFEGDVPVDSLHRIIDSMMAAGVRAISLGDTTGMATPSLVKKTCEALLGRHGEIDLGLHFHNTRGLGLVNVFAGLEMGIARYDSSLGGIGGCPFAPGATGNICTEDLVNMLHESGVETGIDLEALIAVARGLERTMGRPLPGQVMKSGPRLRLHKIAESARAVG